MLYLSCERNESKQIEARLGPFKKPLLNNLIFPHARSYSLSHSSIPHSIFHSFSASFFASFLPHIFIFLSLPSILINLNLLIDVRKARRQGNLGFSTLSTRALSQNRSRLKRKHFERHKVIRFRPLFHYFLVFQNDKFC